MGAKTTVAGSQRPVRVPDPAELADLELLLDGAFAPLDGFLGAADVRSVSEHGRLTGGTPWPAPVTLRASPEFAGHDTVELHDAEGARLAVVSDASTWSDGSDCYVSGTVHPAPTRSTSFHRLRPPAAAVRAAMPDRPVLGVVPDRPLHHRRLAQVRQVCADLGASVLLLPRLLGPRPEALVRAVHAGMAELPSRAALVPIPLRERADAQRDLLLCAHVAAAYGATHLLVDESPGVSLDQSPIPVVSPPEMARDYTDRWRPAERIRPDQRRDDLSERELGELMDAGARLPSWFTTREIARHHAAMSPPLTKRGFTVLFTGLSGAGKSTIAKGLRDELALRDDRAVTLLDGDVVRRMLSEGLGFSAEDRSRNVRRIGWVAAEVTRHGGAAICAPIAPYAADRAEVRTMVSEVGEFVLVHVATPLAECERRDRKGLYAKARDGLMQEFTGVSAPYEVPEDADLALDTSELTPEQAVARVMDLLRARGWVRSWPME